MGRAGVHPRTRSGRARLPKPRKAKIPDFYLDPKELQRNFLKILNQAVVKELEKMIERWARESVRAIMKAINKDMGGKTG
jgi:hypothetical protein